MDFGLSGHVAIVTGASRGLGRAAASALVEQGAQVVAVARSADLLESLRADLGDSVAPHVCDMADHDAVRAIADHAIQQLGRIDIVVNNAGIAPAIPFIEQTLEEWQRTLAINLTAPAMLTQAVGKAMIEAGSGKVINIASTSGLKGKPILAGYSASKGGLIRWTEALAAEWARFGIQVNAIAPGAFETDAQSAVLDSEDLLARRLKKIPARRMGAPQEIGPLVCYLASPLSDFVTGATFVIDGGEVSKL